ncbi:glycosyltransferase [Bacillus mangrovi]|uniref:Glycosyltransferase n=1 Tax=Metabacillus mangrovi TaxID=1491830 RepID=A0A7X2S7G2_9BACI|nr:glycosyltransferase family 4 protein [Metabacillus mangrovi]MTH55038.1 glycosyltransferase [Metabacillus mangrovi]
MKILWITSTYPTERSPGAGVFHQTQADALMKQGVEVQVICPVAHSPKILQMINKKYKKYEIEEHYTRNGVQVYRPKYIAVPGQLKWAQPSRRIAGAVMKIIREQGLEFDAIHAHLAMPSGGAAEIVSKKTNKPYFLTLHGSDVHIYPDYSESARKAFVKAVRGASKVIAVSRKLIQKTAERSGVTPVELPIGINLSKFKGNPGVSKDELRENLDLPKGKKIILYIGRLVKEKGIGELVEAIRQLDDSYMCVLIGNGPLMGQLKENPELRQKVRCTGEISNENVRSYLLASDLFALPSYSEGMPTVLIEALALKIPVVATNVGGIPELMGSSSHLLVEPKNTAQLAERITSLLETDLYSDQTKEDLYAKVINSFDADRNAEKLKKLYEEVIK